MGYERRGKTDLAVGAERGERSADVLPPRRCANLVQHPSVSRVAVVGLPDEKRGEVVAAFILSKERPGVSELKALCREHLSPQKAPAAWIGANEVPLTGSGKLQKFAIRGNYLAGGYGELLDGGKS